MRSDSGNGPATDKIKREWQTPSAQVFDVPSLTKNALGSNPDGLLDCGS